MHVLSCNKVIYSPYLFLFGMHQSITCTVEGLLGGRVVGSKGLRVSGHLAARRASTARRPAGELMDDGYG